eukprot:scaffold186691_cov28-Tisochrysis_lutea.AAC.4
MAPPGFSYHTRRAVPRLDSPPHHPRSGSQPTTTRSRRPRSLVVPRCAKARRSSGGARWRVNPPTSQGSSNLLSVAVRQVHRRAAETATNTASTESAMVDFVKAHPDYDILCLIQVSSRLPAADCFAGSPPTRSRSTSSVVVLPPRA